VKRAIALGLVAVCMLAVGVNAAEPKADADGFYSLFDGKSFDGWKINKENPDTFKVVDGVIVVNGPRTHMFYDGPVGNHNFKSFHFKAEVMTYPKANSGIYFHTEYEDKGWPSKGFECQVNQTHSDVKKTGGLYGVKDVLNQSPVKDNEWFLYEIIVQGKHVVIKINGKTTCDWTQPDDYKSAGRKIGSGTMALQGHDPASKVCYRNIMIKPLAD
jgi:hypothetical protein